MQKRFVIAALCLFAVFVVSGCSSIKSTVYKSSDLTKIGEQIRNSDLPQEERELFAQAILRSSFSGESLEGKKIGEIIEGQRKFKEDAIKREQEEAQAAKLKEANAKVINAGSKILNESMEVIINKVELTYDVLPDKTSGYYTHYPAGKGEVYISVDANIKNLRKQALPCDEIMLVEADYNSGYRYKAMPVVKDGRGDFTYANITAINPLETKGMKFLIKCPEEIETTKNPLFLLFDIEKEKYKYIIR